MRELNRYPLALLMCKALAARRQTIVVAPFGHQALSLVDRRFLLCRVSPSHFRPSQGFVVPPSERELWLEIGFQPILHDELSVLKSRGQGRFSP